MSTTDRAALLTLPCAQLEAAAARLAGQVSDETLRERRENLSAALKRDGALLRQMADAFPADKLAQLGITSQGFVSAIHHLADQIARMPTP